MTNKAIRTYANEHGGRVMILILLFLLALYQLFTSGFPAFAIICTIPVILLAVIAAFHHQMLTFWLLIVINYILQWHNIKLPSGIPMSMYNEMLEIVLIALAIIEMKDTKIERLGNIMFFTLIIWGCYCTLEVLNDTCDLGINVGAWYSGARMMSFQLIY